MTSVRSPEQVEWSREDRCFVARMPALPGCAAHGRTRQAAVREVWQAASGIRAVLRAAGDVRGDARVRGRRSSRRTSSRR